MRTLPTTIAEHSRDGTPLIWLLDVFPTGADSWTQFRWGERAVTVAGNAYEGGIIQAVDAIKDTVRILGGGGVATRDAVTVTLVDKSRELYRTIQQLNLEGRDIQISEAMLPLNQVRNSSFESPTSGNNFDNWTETPGNGSNSITRQTSGPSNGAQYCRLVNAGSPGPTIQSDTFLVRRGTTVSLSFDAKAAAGGTNIRAKIIWNGLYWNNSTRTWQAGATHVNFALTTSWARYTLENVYSTTAPFTNADSQPMSVLFELNAAGTVDIDAVQLEPRKTASSYHGSRTEMATSDLYPVYWGEIVSPKWAHGLIKFSTKSIMNRRHRDIPIAIITQDLDPDYVIPPDNLGKPFPITYGYFLSDHVGFGEIFSSGVVAAAGRLVNAAYPARVYFDRPGMSFNPGTIYHFSPDSMRFFREFLNTAAANYSEWQWSGAGDNYIEAKADARRLRQGLFRLSPLLFAIDIDPDLGDYASFTNPANLSDNDLATFASLTLSSVTTKDLYFRIQKPQELTGLKLIKAFALAKVETVLNSGTATRQIKWFGGNTFTTTILTAGGLFDNVPSALPYNTAEQNFELVLASDDSSAWIGSEVDYYLQCGIIGGSSPNVTFRLYGVGLRLDVAIALPDAIICGSLLGRNYGSTWGGRKTSSSYVSGAIDIIEGILRHELGLVTADINTASFDQAHTDIGSRGGAAGQVVEIKPSIEVIGEICEPSGIVYYVDGAGKEAVRVLKHGAAARTLYPRDFGLEKIEPEFVPREEIVTDFVLNWGYVPFADVYTGQIYCNRNGSNIGDSSYETKCANAYATLGNRENRREYNCRWINDEADAQAVLKFLINWCSPRRRIVKATGFADLLDLEFGDRIDLQLEKQLVERDTDTPRPIFTPYEKTIRKVPNGVSVDISFLEVIEP